MSRNASTRFNGVSANFGDDTPLLTVARIREIHAELEADERLYAELPQRIAATKALLEAARRFLPEGFDLAGLAEHGEPTASREVAEVRSVAQTWISAVFDVLDTADHGLPHKELMEEIKSAHPGLTPSLGDKAFYNAIGKLEKRGDLVKSGGLLYSARVAKKIQDRGEELPDMSVDVRRRSGSAAQIVMDILEQHPKGLTGSDLKRFVSEVPEAPKSIREHGQYIYNVLATLIGAGDVAKNKRGRYHLQKTKS